MIESRSFKYCILRSNTRLKELIRLQIKRRQTSLMEVCRKNNLNYDELRSYMATPFFDSIGRTYASQKDVFALATVLGIRVDLSFEIVK